jgi:hypothetical protein
MQRARSSLADVGGVKLAGLAGLDSERHDRTRAAPPAKHTTAPVDRGALRAATAIRVVPTSHRLNLHVEAWYLRCR